ncbi:LOC102554799 [Phodopus roborovskii]|uniref:LOC102554799 protein n=1 Tax=Phodopus roborovskii TaxID=109678 RepID=A0AAU9YZ30_PHORO|nr:LOC102554799 [Phodopus roborovskii]
MYRSNIHIYIHISAEVKEWVFRLASLLCSFIVWGFGISLAASRYWRLWEFNNKSLHLIYIGLWEAYYYQEVNKSGVITRVPVHNAMNSSWTISIEIEYARGLILLANFMQPIVLVFTSVAIMVCWIRAPYPDFMILCYKTSVLFLILNIICTVLAVSWNHVADIYGKSTLDFPPTFPVGKVDLVRKQKTHVFPQGILMAVLSIISIIMLLHELWLIKPKVRVRPSVASMNRHVKI